MIEKTIEEAFKAEVEALKRAMGSNPGPVNNQKAISNGKKIIQREKVPHQNHIKNTLGLKISKLPDDLNPHQSRCNCYTKDISLNRLYFAILGLLIHRDQRT